jgi:hypothetical protein
MSKPYRPPQVEEQVVLEELQVQLATQEHLPRFQSLLRVASANVRNPPGGRW